MLIVLMVSVSTSGWAQETNKESLQTIQKHFKFKVKGNTKKCLDFSSLSLGWHTISVLGDGDTDLNMYIYKRDTTCYSCNWTLMCNCSNELVQHILFKDTTDRYKVCVQNLGDVYNICELIIE